MGTSWQATSCRLGWTFLVCYCLTHSPLSSIASLVPLSNSIPFTLFHFRIPFPYIFTSYFILLTTDNTPLPLESVKMNIWFATFLLSAKTSAFIPVFFCLGCKLHRIRNHIRICMNAVPKTRILMLRNESKFLFLCL